MTIEAFEWVKSNRPDLTPAPELNGKCGVQNCKTAPLGKLPLCEDHAFDVWYEIGFFHMELSKAGAAHQRKVDLTKAKEEVMQQRMKAFELSVERKREAGVIYYLLVQDQVKIGYTSDLSVRMKAYPPMATLLATHPGTRATERQMHDKFNTYLANRKEWFHLNPELESHIQEIRKQFKQAETLVS